MSKSPDVSERKKNCRKVEYPKLVEKEEKEKK